MDALKAELKQLLEQRDKIEAEIADISARLNAPGMPGVNGPLVDKEGFPRADVDLYQIRTDRHRLSSLHLDHKALTDKMETRMHELHAMARTAGTAAPSGPAPSNIAAAAPRPAPSVAAAGPPAAIALEPFALIDAVAEGSPAHTAGLQVNDRLIAFGTVNKRTASRGLQSVAAEVGAHEGRGVQVAVLRAGAVCEVTVTPGRWSGQGLLGAHMVPL